MADTAEDLAAAARWGDLERVVELVRSGLSVDARDRFGRTLLMLAAAKGQADVASFLLDSGADVDAVEEDGWSPLLYASKSGM